MSVPPWDNNTLLGYVLTEFTSNYNRLATIADSWLTDSVPVAGYSPLNDACCHSLLAPGKRFRPLLCLAAGELLGLSLETLRPFAVALEYVHTFSLVHDDLPAMDNDLLRRGRPTCHVVFGEAAALLAGDCLLAAAFALLAQPAVERSLAQAWSFLLATTVVELCEGQMMDLAASGRTPSSAVQPQLSTLTEIEAEKRLRLRHAKKTGALIKAALQGAVECVADRSVYAAASASLALYGEKLGLLFQLTDDILDATGSSETLGKTAGKDERQGNPTYVSLYGLQGAKNLAQQLAADAAGALDSYGERGAFLKQLALEVLRREK